MNNLSAFLGGSPAMVALRLIVVSFIVGRQPEDAIVVDAAEARAVRLLEQAGLVPGVRHSRQVS